MVCIRESRKPRLCSKLPLFRTYWQMIRTLSLLGPLRAFQWVTVCPCNSRGIKNMTGQSWKRQYLHNKSWTFKFHFSQFWYPFVCLIWKLSDMVNMRQEVLVVAALLASVRMSWKVQIYYINRAFWFSIGRHCSSNLKQWQIGI